MLTLRNRRRIVATVDRQTSVRAEQQPVRRVTEIDTTNSLLAPGSQRRTDLYEFDPAGSSHLTEAKSTAYASMHDDPPDANQQALNVRIRR